MDGVAAEAMERLRREADMADNGDLVAREAFDEGGAVAATFELNGFGASFFEKGRWRPRRPGAQWGSRRR